MKYKVKYQLLIDYIRNNRLVYLIGLFSVIVCNLAQVYFATAMGHVVDFFSSKDFNPKFFIFWADFRNYTRDEIFLIIFSSILLSKIILMVSRYGWRISLARQTHLVAGLLKNHIWEKARFFKYSDFSSKYSKGILMNAANSDVGQARFLFGFILVGIIDTFFLGLFTVICMFQINISLSLVSILFLLFIPVIVRKLSNQEAQDYEASQNALSNFNDLATKAIDTVKLQKLGHTAVFWFKRLRESASFYMEKRLKSQYTSLKYIPFMGMTSIISYVVLFSYGVYLNVNGEISVGEFVSMQGLVFILQDPLMELGFIISEWKKASTSLFRLNEIYIHNKESYLEGEQGESFETKNDYIYELKKISFSYNDNNFIFKNLDLQFSHGDKIGITGQIGTGKSTLIDILSGLQRAHSGVLLFNGHTFSNYDHKTLRNLIVCVHQKPFLFADTIRKNISMDAELSDEKIWNLLRLSGLDKDIESFEKGLDTYLGEWGINLSGGQKQRLTLCRALAKDPEILLLDDGLSAVDTVTEELILSNLNKYLKDTTIVWVAHRRSTLKYCTRIIDLDEL